MVKRVFVYLFMQILYFSGSSFVRLFVWCFVCITIMLLLFLNDLIKPQMFSWIMWTFLEGRSFVRCDLIGCICRKWFWWKDWFNCKIYDDKFVFFISEERKETSGKCVPFTIQIRYAKFREPCWPPQHSRFISTLSTIWPRPKHQM